jgi:hypothetical protein
MFPCSFCCAFTKFVQFTLCQELLFSHVLFTCPYPPQIILINFHCCFGKMVVVFDSLCDAVPVKNSWRFRVQVARLWTVSEFWSVDQINSIEMVLNDDKVYCILFVHEVSLNLWNCGIFELSYIACIILFWVLPCLICSLFTLD